MYERGHAGPHECACAFDAAGCRVPREPEPGVLNVGAPPYYGDDTSFYGEDVEQGAVIRYYTITDAAPRRRWWRRLRRPRRRTEGWIGIGREDLTVAPTSTPIFIPVADITDSPDE